MVRCGLQGSAVHSRESGALAWNYEVEVKEPTDGGLRGPLGCVGSTTLQLSVSGSADLVVEFLQCVAQREGR